MMPTRLPAAAAALLVIAAAHGDDAKPAAGSDRITLTSHAGDVAGEVVKVDKGTITLKVPEVAQTGVSYRRVSGHAVAVPRLAVKHVEVSYPLADTVTVRTVGGKDAGLDDVKKGQAVVVHVNKVREGKVGEKLESHAEVKKIDIPNAPAHSADKK